MSDRITINGVTHAIRERHYEQATTWTTGCGCDWGTYTELQGHPDVDGELVNCIECLGIIRPTFTPIEAHEAIVTISNGVVRR